MGWHGSDNMWKHMEEEDVTGPGEPKERAGLYPTNKAI